MKNSIMSSDAQIIIDILEHDYCIHHIIIKPVTLQAIVRLIDESSHNKLDTLAETIILLLQYTDTRKREAFVAALDDALRRAGHCDTFESVFRTTEYEIYGDAMLMADPCM